MPLSGGSLSALFTSTELIALQAVTFHLRPCRCLHSQNLRAALGMDPSLDTAMPVLIL